MIQNKILDYEQVEQKLQKICENSNGKIEKKADLAITNYGLPIHYYTIGHGKKEMVITRSDSRLRNNHNRFYFKLN